MSCLNVQAAHAQSYINKSLTQALEIWHNITNVHCQLRLDVDHALPDTAMTKLGQCVSPKSARSLLVQLQVMAAANLVVIYSQSIFTAAHDTVCLYM